MPDEGFSSCAYYYIPSPTLISKLDQLAFSLWDQHLGALAAPPPPNTLPLALSSFPLASPAPGLVLLIHPLAWSQLLSDAGQASLPQVCLFPQLQLQGLNL